jgi:hypothetical protein
MRISKKYAGKGIGKKVFISKVNSPPSGTTKPHPPELYANLARMMEAESKFFRVAFPELQALLVRSYQIVTKCSCCPRDISPLFIDASFQFPFIAGPFVSDNQIPLASHGVGAPPVLSNTPTVAHPIALKVDQSPAIQIEDVCRGATQNIIVPSMKPSVALPPCFGPRSEIVVSPNPATLTLQHQGFACVPTLARVLPVGSLGGTVQPGASAPSFVEIPTNPSIGIFQHATPAQRLGVQPDVAPAPMTAVVEAEKKEHEEVGALQRLHEAYVSSILKQASSVATEHCSEKELKMHTSQATGHAPERKSPPTPENVATVSKHQGAMPDFLSGFDEVSGRKTSVRHPTGRGDYDPYSPTYTTESFDDLHQFLGKNLTPLNMEGPPYPDNENTFTKPILPRMQTLASPATKKRAPEACLQMRPWKRSGRVGTSAMDGEESSQHRSTQNTFDTHAAQLSAYFHGHCGRDPSHQEHLHMPVRDFEVDDLSLNCTYGAYDISAPFTSNRSTPAAVSEPSEYTSDDVNSGNESGNLADSDETQSDEGSVHRTKRNTSESGDFDDEFRSWYKTLVLGPQD